MRRPLPVPVEPLSSQRWAKIERSLFSRLEVELASGAARPSESLRPWTRRPFVWLVAASAMLVAIAVLLLSAWRSTGTAGGVEQASRITTGSTGSHLVLPELTLDVEPESTVVVGVATERGMLLVLDRGRVVLDVRPRPADAPLIVQAGAAQVRVVGTRFRVERQGESARVAVEHGLVEVAMNGVVTRVASGQVWPAAAVASAEPSAAATTPQDEPLGPSEPSAERRLGVRAKTGASAPPRDAAPPLLSAQARFEQAARLERADPAEAIALYRAIESGTDSWAQNALYAHGRLEAARGNSAQARQVLERYLVRFPKGVNHDDARALLERLR